MPNIIQYNSPIDKIQPSENAADTMVRMARVQGSMDREAGDVYGRVAQQAGEMIDKHDTLADISTGSAALSVLSNNLHNGWNKTVTGPNFNRNTSQQSFMDETNQELDKWASGFSTEAGQKWAMERVNSLRDHFQEKTSSDVSDRIGSDTVQSWKTTLNTLSETARNDFTTMDQGLNQISAMVKAAKENSDGRLAPKEIEKLELLGRDMNNEVVKSGMVGLAEKNPQAMVDVINSGKLNSYIPGTEAEQLIQHAQTVSRMKLEDQDRTQRQQERQQKLANEQKANEIANSWVDPETGKTNVPADAAQQIMKIPGMDVEAKVKLIGAAKHIADATDNQEVLQDFAGRAGSDNPNRYTRDDLTNALASGKMTIPTFNFLDKLIKDTPDAKAESSMVAQTLADAKTQLTGASGGIITSSAAERKYSRFQTWFLPTYQQALKDPALAGLSDAQKAQKLLSPDSPMYLLGPEVMKQFKTSGNDVVQSSIFSRVFGNSPPTVSKSGAPVVPGVPAEGTPERKEWVKKQLFGGNQ